MWWVHYVSGLRLVLHGFNFMFLFLFSSLNKSLYSFVLCLYQFLIPSPSLVSHVFSSLISMSGSQSFVPLFSNEPQRVFRDTSRKPTVQGFLQILGTLIHKPPADNIEHLTDYLIKWGEISLWMCCNWIMSLFTWHSVETQDNFFFFLLV